MSRRGERCLGAVVWLRFAFRSRRALLSSRCLNQTASDTLSPQNALSAYARQV